MSIKHINFLFFVFFICITYSQKLEVTVKDNLGKPIPRANIVIKISQATSEVSEFFITNDKGFFSYNLKKKYDNEIFIEVSALNYEKTTKIIGEPETNETYRFDFILASKATKLEEVIISERKKFNIKKDTIVFNTEAYKDGTERKVEDLIKKLPGMEVAENGKIKYKGKTVKSVQLDGDDLFGYNYAVGTKNISIDMVDQIEAIDNYSKNPLLSGIKNSDQVALNLKLKKGKVDFSATPNLGYGFGNQSYYDLSTSVLGISKSFKSFGTLSYNNIGVGNSPFDYFSRSTSVEKLVYEDLYSKTIINQTPLNSVLNNDRTRVNNEWFVNYNFIYRFSPKLSIKTNLYYVEDEFFRQELFQNTFFLSDENINYIDQTDIIRRPDNKRLDLGLTYNPSKKSLLEIEASVSRERVSDNSNFIRNLETSSNVSLHTDNFFLNNKFKYTHKLTDNSALQLISQYSRNNTPQRFSTFGNFLSEEIINNQYFQFSEYRKEVFQNNLVFLGKKRKTKYAVIAGFNYYDSPFKSFLQENGIELFDFKNDFEYKKANQYTHFSLTYKSRKLKIEPSLVMNWISQRLDNKLTQFNTKNSGFYPEPSLKLSYHLNPVSTLRFTGNLEQKTPNENVLFENGIITNNRLVTRSITSLNLEKRQKYVLNYRYNDLFKNIDLSLATGYTNRKNVYLSNINVNSNFSEVTYFQLPVHLDDYFFSMSSERYLSFIKTTFKLSSQYTISNFKNIINQSQLRNGQMDNFNASIFTKTAFRIPINFQNSITFNSSIYKIGDLQANSNNTIKNSFKTLFKPHSNWFLTLSYDYFKPNTESSKDFSFLDFEINYKPKKIKWLSARFAGKNLLDTIVFEQTDNSDFSTTLYQSNLIPRYFMLSLDVSL
ncbi:TonB-dependent receptor [Aquimarina sp. RZ0]|uniref:TonB-dependent receptor n=1 Tax=Aquimarina sp. RZ0 TaxID=2607730 RepID=UPI0011F0D78B|nr:TonB-dependent receptor [Aquimarina sp. RZ0]KAA1244590.1 TonB-dependent receptor [Aquimarina sp. RZ0]